MQKSAKNNQGQVALYMAAILNQSEVFLRFTILGYSVTCSQNLMQIGEPCFWTTLHGFTGDTLLRSVDTTES